MNEKELAANLRGLAADPRFAAVAALIDQIKTQTAEESSEPSYAALHGNLAHAAGGVFALRILEGKLRRFIEPPRKTGMQKESE